MGLRFGVFGTRNRGIFFLNSRMSMSDWEKNDR